MKIRSKNRQGNKVLLEIEEEYSKFEKSVNKTLVEAGKEVQIPGFRPGKAPKEMVEKTINREAVESRAAQNLISEIYPKIIEEAKLEPVDYPNVEVLQQEKEKPFVFKLSVDVYPEVKLGKYKGLKVEKKSDEPEGEVKNKLIAAVSADTKADIPSGMIEREINIMLDELRASLAQNQLTLEDYLKGIKKEEKSFRDELRKSAEIRVRGKVVLKAVASEERMKISEEEMEEEIKKIVSSSGEKMEDSKKRLGEEGKKYIEDYMLRTKALEFLVKEAKIKEGDKT